MRDRCRAAALSRLQGNASSSSATVDIDAPSSSRPQDQYRDGNTETFTQPKSGPTSATSHLNVQRFGDVIDLEDDFDQGEQINGVHGGGIERRKAGVFGAQGKLGSSDESKNAKLKQARIFCPVCNQSWEHLPNAELNRHIDACLSDNVEVLE